MSKRDPQVTLRQIQECALRAQELCTTNTLEQVLADWQKRAAFERVMEVLGEAVKRLAPDLTSRYAAVDWRGIAGMRDHISHGYDAVDYHVLWQAAQTQVPGLLKTVSQMLANLEKPPTSS